MHVTLIPTCINFLSRFQSIKFLDDHGLSKWWMTLIWCVVVATDSNTCVRAVLVLKPGAHVPTAYQIVLDAVIIALVSHARLLERFLCLRRWLVVASLPPLRLPAHHSLFLPQMTLYLLASFRTVISVLCCPLLTKRVTTWSQICHLPPQVLHYSSPSSL